MKTLLIIITIALSVFATNVSAGEINHEIFYTVGTHHVERHSAIDGQDWNEINPGVGYTISDTFNNNVVVKASVMYMAKDSYSNPFYTATAGVGYGFSIGDLHITPTFEFGVGSKICVYTVDGVYDHGERKLLPIAFIPNLEVEYKGLTAGVTFVPGIKYNGLVVDAVTMLTVGYKFSL